mmetsp:Transcript_7314/g.7475  ORF Transcript_7314/g.7475 Transcript_7314/m.7475 type:complete len:124 (+) Transcript_7314:459-830(+)
MRDLRERTLKYLMKTHKFQFVGKSFFIIIAYFVSFTLHMQMYLRADTFFSLSAIWDKWFQAKLGSGITAKTRGTTRFPQESLFLGNQIPNSGDGDKRRRIFKTVTCAQHIVGLHEAHGGTNFP